MVWFGWFGCLVGMGSVSLSLGGQMLGSGLHDRVWLGGDDGAVVVGDQGGGGVVQGVGVGSSVGTVDSVSSVGVAGKVGISLSLPLLSAVKSISMVGVTVGSVGGVAVGVGGGVVGVQGGVEGDHGAVGVSHQASISLGLSLGLTLSQKVNSGAVAVQTIPVPLGREVSVGGGDVVGVVGDGGTVGVVHQGGVPGTGRSNNSKEQESNHVSIGGPLDAYWHPFCKQGHFHFASACAHGI